MTLGVQFNSLNFIIVNVKFLLIRLGIMVVTIGRFHIEANDWVHVLIFQDFCLIFIKRAARIKILRVKFFISKGR